MHAWVKQLKKHTDAGAILIYDGDVIKPTRWVIQKKYIAIVVDYPRTICHYVIFDEGDDPAENEADLRKRIKVYQEIEIASDQCSSSAMSTASTPHING